ncbi:WxL domain-containing protein [Enterococcus ureasiticus]|uniref:WxL domain-containing protein n=1 Tax=Enterococcus ureasiticus TaxID=903984 RepID=UPI001A8FC850|nr:WxL domain-containing protein [Enterococcus ureasiticus]MBO0473620.1 WxL domain-containing protein [Enterococcus ureasiticus]
MKKIIPLLAVGVLYGAFTIQSNTADAESNANSNATFSLEAQDQDGGGTDPILPIPPTGNTGPLTIDAVSSFVFPNAKISGEALTVVGESAQVNGSAGTMGAQVTDSRGSGAGWTLKAKITDFTGTDTDNTARTLKGAVLTLPQGQVKTSDTATAVADANKPVSNAVSLNATDQKLLTAAQGNGLGVWYVNFENDSQGVAQKEVKLYVPTGNFKADYKATISWTLTEAPE